MKSNDERIREKRKNSSEQARLDLRNTMSTPHGRRLMWHILSTCGLYANCFDGSGARTAFNCGRQAVGQQLLAEILAAAPDEYMTMQREQASS